LQGGEQLYDDSKAPSSRCSLQERCRQCVLQWISTSNWRQGSRWLRLTAAGDSTQQLHMGDGSADITGLGSEQTGMLVCVRRQLDVAAPGMGQGLT
jgi:hypothetical protein